MKKDITIEKAHRANKINIEELLKNKDSYQSFVLDKKTKESLYAIPTTNPRETTEVLKNTATIETQNTLWERIQALFSLQSFSGIPRYAIYSLSLFLLAGMGGLFYLQQQKHVEKFSYQADFSDEMNIQDDNEMGLLASSASSFESKSLIQEEAPPENGMMMQMAIPAEDMVETNEEESLIAEGFAAKSLAVEKKPSFWEKVKNFFLAIKNKVKGLFS